MITFGGRSAHLAYHVHSSEYDTGWDYDIFLLNFVLFIWPNP